MRVTQENISELLVAISDVKENLEMVEEAAQEWTDAKEGEEDADTIREAREALDESLEQLDVSTLCQLVHGKHKR